MTKLVDRFGTKYFTGCFAEEVRQFLSTVDEVDLAGARITRDVMKYITSAAYGGLVVRDTEDPVRDELFKENRRRREQEKEIEPYRVSLPIPPSQEDLLPYIRALRTDVIYTIPDGAQDVQRAYVFLAQAVRPEVKIDLGIYVGDVLAFIYRNLFPEQHHWEEFYVRIGSTFHVQRPPQNEYAKFVSENICVPTDFGTKKLLDLPEWEKCVDRISLVLERYLRPTHKRIADYL